MSGFLIREGNTVRVKVPYCRQEFDATVTGFEPGGWVRILPIDRWPTWRRVCRQDIEERIDPPLRRRRRRAAA